jgi:hypothetical protein
MGHALLRFGRRLTGFLTKPMTEVTAMPSLSNASCGARTAHEFPGVARHSGGTRNSEGAIGVRCVLLARLPLPPTTRAGPPPQNNTPPRPTPPAACDVQPTNRPPPSPARQCARKSSHSQPPGATHDLAVLARGAAAVDEHLDGQLLALLLQVQQLGHHELRDSRHQLAGPAAVARRGAASRGVVSCDAAWRVCAAGVPLPRAEVDGRGSCSMHPCCNAAAAHARGNYNNNNKQQHPQTQTHPPPPTPPPARARARARAPQQRTGMPRYTIRWSNRSEGRSGGGGRRRSPRAMRAATATCRCLLPARAREGTQLLPPLPLPPRAGCACAATRLLLLVLLLLLPLPRLPTLLLLLPYWACMVLPPARAMRQALLCAWCLVRGCAARGCGCDLVRRVRARGCGGGD